MANPFLIYALLALSGLAVMGASQAIPPRSLWRHLVAELGAAMVATSIIFSAAHAIIQLA